MLSTVSSENSDGGCLYSCLIALYRSWYVCCFISPRACRFLPDGSVFDASNAPGRKPIAFKLGARQVIKGWEEVLRLMNVREDGGGSQQPGHTPLRRVTK